jgi:hypothetical protein
LQLGQARDNKRMQKRRRRRNPLFAKLLVLGRCDFYMRSMGSVAAADLIA